MPRYQDLEALILRHPITKYITDEHVLLRPAVELTLYSNLPIEVIAPKIADAWEAFADLIGPYTCDARWGTGHGGWSELTPRTVASRMRALRSMPAGNHFDLYFSSSDPPGSYGSVGTHAFRFHGGDKKVLGIALPLTFLDEGRAPAILSLLAALGEHIDYSLGHAGLTFLTNWTRDKVRPISLCARYLGIIPCKDHFWKHQVAEGKTVGSHWVDLLGPEILAKLGGKTVVRARLPAAVELVPVGEGVMVRSAELPPIGDLQMGAPDLAYVPDVARLLGPLPHVVDGEYVGWPARLEQRASLEVPAWPPFLRTPVPMPPTSYAGTQD